MAVTTWRLPNSALAEVFEPVRNPPSPPSTALKKGNSTPVVANTRPRVAGFPGIVHDERQRENRGDGDFSQKDLLAGAPEKP